MRLAWQVVKLTVLDFFEELFLLILFNLLWSLSAFLVLPLPFASAGLAWVAAEISEGKAIKWRTFLEGGRRYWRPAYLWGLVNLLVSAIIFLNLRFYASINDSWVIIARSLVLSMAILWGGLQLYVFPILIRQEVPSLKLAYRNGLVLLGTQPILTIVVFVLAAALLLLSLLLTLPLFLAYFAFVTLLANRAVVESLKAEIARNT